MSDTYSDWDEHVTEVTIKEDSDHASLMAVQIKPNGEKVLILIYTINLLMKSIDENTIPLYHFFTFGIIHYK